MKPRPKLPRTDPTLPEKVQAVSLALQILKAAGCTTWEVLLAHPEHHRRAKLTPGQQKLLAEHTDALPHIGVSPLRSIIYCPACERWALAGKNPGRKARCTLTIGCDGVLTYASPIAPKILTLVPRIPET